MLHPKINPRWSGTAVVAGSGPSLELEDLELCRDRHLIVVNDAYRLAPWAHVLYACDEVWWDAHRGAPDFMGERWSSHDKAMNEKLACAERWKLNLVAGLSKTGFSMDPARIHYGGNSGFQAMNLALLWGATRVLLLGFDMQGVNHFFGKHPRPMRSAGAERFIPAFKEAARTLPAGIEIINCTPSSALECFPRKRLSDALALREQAAPLVA